MCWNKETSLSSFIIGTLVNIFILFYSKNISVKAACIVLQWVLMMQLSEFLIWKDQNCGKINKIGSKMALFFNLTQPVIVYLVCISMFNISINVKIISSIIILIYICYMFVNLNKNYDCVKPTKNCSHLDLKWWKNLNYGGLFYTISLVLLILLMLKPLKLGIFMISYILITLFVSSLFYGCGGPSMWCFMVVPLPLFIYLFNKYFV